MKRFLITLALLPALAACGNAVTVYEVTTDIEEEGRANELLLASTRVIERRLASLGEEPLDINLNRSGGTNTITVEANNDVALDVLTEAITAPFDFVVMEEDGNEATADIVVEGHGGFSATGVTGEQVIWLESSEEPGGKGRVTIIFTEEGRAMMNEVFQKNSGRNIGIFVRDQLISKLFVDTDELKEDIIITGIPTASLAKVFADDVNVGLHVTFTPIN